jgi:parallel beta-helix repeat protein
MDIVAGDRLALLPTSFDNMASDDVFVKSYDTLTGETHLMSKLDWYHWGALESRASEYNGADMRGEVLLLTRNIRIAGEDIESWGGQIVTSDTVEINSLGEMAVRSGSTVMENVEVYNCSQIDTQKAAIRWEGATQKYSEVTNCTFHNGYSWGVYIKSSTNILFRDNIVFNFRPVGINLSNTKNVTIDHNVIGHIQ